MSRSYEQIAFTDSVGAQQERYGSRRFYARHQKRAEEGDGSDALTDEIRDYLADRDGFYLASVGETGWPYVQYRGGPPGFLRVLGDHTIGWADFRGNFQYISTGNVTGDDRVALIVMDYPSRRRLKIFAHASIHYADEEPDLVDRLADHRYDAEVERGVIVQVAAFDWNCQQHITPRYSLDELRPQINGLQHQLAALQSENSELRRLLEAMT